MIIIAQTADAAEDVTDKCLKFGMNDIITKPIEKAILLRMIRKYAKNVLAWIVKIIENNLFLFWKKESHFCKFGIVKIFIITIQLS